MIRRFHSILRISSKSESTTNFLSEMKANFYSFVSVSKWTELDLSGSNGQKWTELGENGLNWTKMDQSGLNWTEWTEMNRSEHNLIEWAKWT